MSIMPHHQPRLEDAFLTRRDFLCKCGMGMGALGFASLMAQTGLLPTEARAGEIINPLALKLLDGTVKEGQTVRVDEKDARLVFLHSSP